MKPIKPVRYDTAPWAQPSDDPKNNRPHFVYRVYDANDELLYVGVTVNVKQRMRLHKSNRVAWYGRMATVDTKEYPDKPSARLAEAKAINAEHPEFNVQMNHRTWLFPTP